MSLRHIKRVKILGAGSIGNHLAHAARRLECDVVVTDISDQALERMRREVYPSRYGTWDDAIELRQANDVPIGGFDLICIGTPPDSHIRLALEAIKETPKALQIEKPLCPPDMSGAASLADAARRSGTRVFVGYDHVIGKATQTLERMLSEGAIGDIATLDVEFREHWGGIFKAHPWLNGPADSYLGFWKRGGGAGGEHSHALNLWQHLSHVAGGGRVTAVSASIRYVNSNGVDYDDLCLCQLRTEHGLVGRVVQDVVTRPVKKEALIIGSRGTLRWVNGYNACGDAVILSATDRAPEVIEVPKTRPDDFIWELQHLDASLEGGTSPTPLALERGSDTMLVIAAAHQSQALRRVVGIDYAKGPTLEALN